MSEAQVVEQATVTPSEQEVSASLSAGYNRAKGPSADAPPAKTEAAKTEAAADTKADTKADATAKDAPAKDDKPAASDAAATEAAPAADPWEGVNPIVRSTLEGISKSLGKLDSIEHDLKSTVGRVGSLQSAFTAATKQAAKAGAEAPSQSQVAAAAQTSDSWKKLKDDFPEWAGALDERLAAEGKALRAAIPQVDTEAISKAIEERLTPKFTAQSKAIKDEARALARIDRKHEGWEAKINTPQFAAWITTQAPDVQALADSNAANDAIRLLDLYDEHAKAEAVKAKNRARLATVVTPKQASSGGPSVLPDEAGLSVGYNRVKRA